MVSLNSYLQQVVTIQRQQKTFLNLPFTKCIAGEPKYEEDYCILENFIKATCRQVRKKVIRDSQNFDFRKIYFTEFSVDATQVMLLKSKKMISRSPAEIAIFLNTLIVLEKFMISGTGSLTEASVAQAVIVLILIRNQQSILF